jgi:hypothetical protein
MQMQNIGLALGLASLGIIANSLAAQALDFSFSFTINDSSHGSISGTVTGIIEGLQDNTTQSTPTDIIVNTNPAGVTSGTTFVQGTGTNSGYFTVQNGNITGISSGGIEYISSGGNLIGFSYNNNENLIDGPYGNYFDTETAPPSGSAFSISSYNFQQVQQTVPWELDDKILLMPLLMIGISAAKKRLPLKVK